MDNCNSANGCYESDVSFGLTLTVLVTTIDALEHF